MRLIVAPHADDESLGCGGLIAKYPTECHITVMASTPDVRFNEFSNAMKELDCGSWSVGRFEDGRLGEDMYKLVGYLDYMIDQIRPDSVYLPFPSSHQDHVAVYEAGMRACRMSMSSEHWFVPNVFVYDVAVYDLNLYPSDLRWNVFEELTGEQVAAKKRACDAYESQVPEGFHPMNGVVEMAHAIGQARKVWYAEQYALVRSVR